MREMPFVMILRPISSPTTQVELLGHSAQISTAKGDGQNPVGKDPNPI